MELDKRNDHTGENLIGADLNGADLAGALLNGAILCGADLTGADLTGAALGGADLTAADLTGAKLAGADLEGAIVTRAKFGADFRLADLSPIPAADLTGSPAPRLQPVKAQAKTRPGEFVAVSQLERDYHGYFFSRGAKRFFDSGISKDGRTDPRGFLAGFVSSERFDHNSPRLYTSRYLLRKGGSTVWDIGKFQGCGSSAEANREIDAWIAGMDDPRWGAIYRSEAMTGAAWRVLYREFCALKDKIAAPVVMAPLGKWPGPGPVGLYVWGGARVAGGEFLPGGAVLLTADLTGGSEDYYATRYTEV